MTMSTWKEITAERYADMLDVMPPAVHRHHGFLVGEAWTHRVCEVTGQSRAAYAAFVRTDDGRHFEALEPMTPAEFLRVLSGPMRPDRFEKTTSTRLNCPHCGEHTYSDDLDEGSSTWQQWQCQGCGSWNDRD
jgi:hypothetical protein